MFLFAVLLNDFTFSDSARKNKNKVDVFRSVPENTLSRE
jgi:hypothetical protein